MRTKHFIKKNMAVIAGLAIASGGFVGIYFLGKQYIDNSKYDFMMGINRKDNMNYATSAGDITRTVVNFQEGITSNAIVDPASVSLIEDESAWGSEELRQEYVDLTETDSFKEVEDIDADREDVEIIGEGQSLSGSKFSIAEEGWVSTDATEFKLFMREGLHWSTGEEIKASDFGFALHQIIDARNGSAARYMAAKYIDLQGAYEWEQHQNQAIDAGEEENWTIRDKMFFDKGSPTKNAITGEANKGTENEAAFVFNNEEGWFTYKTTNPNPVFSTILQNPIFLPVNQVWLESNNMTLRDMGVNEKTLSTYGAFNVESFDPSYGLELKKNKDYHNADAIASESMAFRTIKEQSTQLAMFNSGEITTFHPDEVLDKSVLLGDSNASQYVDWQLSNPTSRYVLFNLAPNNTRASAKYYKNANFRKALFSSFDRSIWIELTGSDRAVPSGVITPSDFGSFADTTEDSTKRTIVDYAYNALIDEGQEAERYIGHHDEETRQNILLTDQADMRDVDYVRGTTESESTNGSDPIVNKDLSTYYWNEFLNDMAAANISVPNRIELEFATANGDSDPIIQAMRQSFNNANIPIDITIRTYVGSAVPVWQAGSYDFIELGWNPDVGSPWGSLSTYNGVDLARSFNVSVSWNFWTGSAHSYGNTYSDTEKQNIYANWENDGLFKPKSGVTDPVTNDDWEYNEELMTRLIPDTITADKEDGSPVIMDGLHDFMSDSIKIGTDTTAGDITVNIDGGTGDDNGYVTPVVSGTTQTQIYSLSEQDQARLFIMFEGLNQNGMASLQFRSALPNGVPNKSPFMSSIPLGYPTQIYSYNPSLKEELGYPSQEDILKYR